MEAKKIKPKQKSQVSVWDFSTKALSHSVEDMKTFLREHCKKWVFQEEKGEMTGYMHYQGRASLKVKARIAPWLKDTQWSVTSNENRDNQFYVMKTDTRVNGPWANTDRYIPSHVRDITLYPWQQSVLNSAAQRDLRKINVLVCPAGNIGKSTLATYAGCHGLARTLPIMDSFKDYSRMIMDCPKSKLYLVDFPRSMNKNNCVGFWSAMEQLKNGYAYDDRYGFREEYFEIPVIWIFTNSMPDTKHLSQDRWHFWRVHKDHLAAG